MRKFELAKELAVSERLHLSTAMKAVDGLIRIAKERLAQGEDITVRGFGSLYPVEREGRMARNPKTGDEVWVEPHRTVKFKPGAEFKALMNSKPGEEETGNL